MTFMGRDGRQYVVIAAGGDGLFQSPVGTQIVAFALPLDDLRRTTFAHAWTAPLRSARRFQQEGQEIRRILFLKAFLLIS